MHHRDECKRIGVCLYGCLVVVFDFLFQGGFVVLSARVCLLTFVHDASGLRVCFSCVTWGKMFHTVEVTCSLPDC